MMTTLISGPPRRDAACSCSSSQGCTQFQADTREMVARTRTRQTVGGENYTEDQPNLPRGCLHILTLIRGQQMCLLFFQ